MENDKNKLLPLGLEYYSGIFDIDEFNANKIRLRDNGIELLEYNKTGIPMDFFDEFTNQVSLLLSNPLVKGYILDLFTNGGYDVLKGTIIWMWNSLIGKQITKIYSGGKHEKKDITFGLHVEIDKHTKIDFRLTGDVSDELKSKCIDDAFNLIKTHHKNNKATTVEFAKYDWNNQKWFIVNINEEINKLIKKQNRQSNYNKNKCSK